jgi:signal transduction histidine kinase
MRENLRSNGGEDLPIVMQYNKRDLPDILGEAELDRHFCWRAGIEAFPTVATEGQGVFEAFVHAAALLVESKVALYGLGRGQITPQSVAEGARNRLFEICDQVRRERAQVRVADLPQTKVAIKEDDPGTRLLTTAPPPEPVLDPAVLAEDDAPLLELRHRAPAAVAAPAAEDDVPIRYELRDSVPHEGRVAVLSEAELSQDLGATALDFANPDAVVEEVDGTLLGKTVQSNLELVERFGELDEQNQRLQQKLEELVEIGQRAAHDLSKPVMPLKALLWALKRGSLGELNDAGRQRVTEAERLLQHMERLLRDLIDGSRLDHDGVQMQFAEVDMTLLLAEVLQLLRSEIEEKGVHVRLEPLPQIKADAWALTKVFANLLGNAIQYAASDRQPLVTVSAHEDGDGWQFRVQDNGIGIPTDGRDRLFRRFERGSNTAGITGTGLGLHIVRELVHGHSGRVTFESKVGEGTTFFVFLPKEPVQPPHSPLADIGARIGT